jgi:hypothetical protein
MADVPGIDNRLPQLPTQTQPAQKPAVQSGQLSPLEKADDPLRILAPEARTSIDAPIGPPGELGQPTGMPIPVKTGKLLPDAIAGRDESQLIAAEQLRTSGGGSVIEQLLGLNLQPTMAGALIAPPGNSDFLRHMTTAMRRATIRELLQKQRREMRRLARLLQRDGEKDDDEQSRESDDEGEDLRAVSSGANDRERMQVANAARMLHLLEQLLAMQDYTWSRMGKFSKG